jgi:hypothetical protein
MVSTRPLKNAAGETECYTAGIGSKMAEQEISFSNSLSEAGKALFAEPLTDATRTSQKHLLVWSSLLLAVQYGLITIAEIDISGAKLSLSVTSSIQWGLGIVVLYFLLTFSVGAFQNYRLFKYSALAAKSILMRLTAEHVKKMRELQLSFDSAFEGIMANRDMREEIRLEWEALRRRQQDEMQEIYEKQRALETEPSPPGEDEMARSFRQFPEWRSLNEKTMELGHRYDKQMEPYWDLIESFDQYDTSKKLVQKLQGVTDEITLEGNRLRAIRAASKGQRRLSILRLMLDVSVPSGMAIWALSRLFG